MSHRQFIFQSYVFDASNKSLALTYSVDDTYQFTENFQFDFDFVPYDTEVLDRALQNLFFVAGVSYFKAFIPPEIIVKTGVIDVELAGFLTRTYEKGLGEFWYSNNLDPSTPVKFPKNGDPIAPIAHSGKGLLVGLGGGKDSLVTLEFLKNQPDTLTWNAGNHPRIIEPLVQKTKTPHAYVRRQVDPKLYELGDAAYNGHVPLSAILACLGTVGAILSGKQDVVVSNEQSANEETLQYKGVSINHQYSKTHEFERDYQQLLAHCFGESVRYYSFLRPLSELRIAEIFAQTGFEKYKHVFSSCNRAFRHNSQQISWCGVCPKCVFIFLALTPFIERSELVSLWGGKNLLLDPAHEPMYRKLLGIEGDKPLECVGEIKESRAAMRLAQKVYPELKDKYEFELPKDYDYKALSTHEMPDEIYKIFEHAMQRF